MLNRLVLFAIMILIAPSMKAEQGRFDSMVNDRASWPTAKLISAADSLMKTGQEDEAMVLYMMAASRPAKDGSAREMKLHVEANLHAGDIHYAKGNYSNALRFYVAGLKLSEAAEEQPYLAVLYKNMGNVFMDYEKGQSLYLRGLEAARRANDSETSYKLLQNLVGVSINLNDVAAARKYFEQSQATSHKASDESRYMDGYTLALILKHEGKDMQSIAQFRKLAGKAKETGYKVLYSDMDGTVSDVNSDGTMAVGWFGPGSSAWIWTEKDGFSHLQNYIDGKGHAHSDLSIVSVYDI